MKSYLGLIGLMTYNILSTMKIRIFFVIILTLLSGLGVSQIKTENNILYISNMPRVDVYYHYPLIEQNAVYIKFISDGTVRDILLYDGLNYYSATDTIWKGNGSRIHFNGLNGYLHVTVSLDNNGRLVKIEPDPSEGLIYVYSDNRLCNVRNNEVLLSYSKNGPLYLQKITYFSSDYNRQNWRHGLIDSSFVFNENGQVIGSTIRFDSLYKCCGIRQDGSRVEYQKIIYSDSTSLGEHLIGQAVEYYPNGNVRFIRNYDGHGGCSGEFIEYYENGNVKRKGMCINRNTGCYYDFTRSGKPKRVVHYNGRKKVRKPKVECVIPSDPENKQSTNRLFWWF